VRAGRADVDVDDNVDGVADVAGHDAGRVADAVAVNDRGPR
jgi:hypothetical protein